MGVDGAAAEEVGLEVKFDGGFCAFEDFEDFDGFRCDLFAAREKRCEWVCEGVERVESLAGKGAYFRSAVVAAEDDNFVGGAHYVEY